MTGRRGFSKGFGARGGRAPEGRLGGPNGLDSVRSVPGERFTVSNEGLIEGHVIVFDERTKILDMFWEEVAPGATLGTIADPQNDIRALKNHNDDWVLGRQGNSTVELVEDERGLLARITPPKTQWADDLRTQIRRGDIPGASFRFRPLRTETTLQPDGLELDRLLEISVSEVSVGVPWPAYEGTQIDARGRGLFPPSFRGLFGSLSAAVREGDGAEFDRCVGLLRERLVVSMSAADLAASAVDSYGFEEDPASQLAVLELMAVEAGADL